MEGSLQKDEVVQARGYQLEMLEESLRENVIVAMDTGSGKTQIAVLRIKAELETCPKDQFVWFIAPTTALVHQQFNVLQTQLPAYQGRLLVGADNVQYWRKETWTLALENIRIAVSTPQILFDALNHGFVRMEELALLVFDEAHCCVRNHPAALIMKNFYHSALDDPKSPSRRRPHILGLTASPVMRARNGELERLEANLDAIARTPKVFREELLQYIYPPVICKVVYAATPKQINTPIMQRLLDIYSDLDIQKDPYVQSLLRRQDEDAKNLLFQVLNTGKTYCRDYLKRTCIRTSEIQSELGSWAADYFLKCAIENFNRCSAHMPEFFSDWESDERNYLHDIFALVPINEVEASPTEADVETLSPKVKSLIDLLTKEDISSFRGMIFVKQRATVAVLAHILAVHPLTKDRFSPCTFVGTSVNVNRRVDVTDLLDPRNQIRTLDDLRTGLKNLVVTTSVLEEGIDVSACNIVICFEPPENLKSFIQRRGRARKKESKYVLMFEDGEIDKVLLWNDLEEKMKEAYMDDLRKWEEFNAAEAIGNTMVRSFRVPNTGALLTLDNAISHLQHFCSTLTGDAYVNRKPEFVFLHKGDRFQAKAVLPSMVDEKLREAIGSTEWVSERLAIKDAAFEAYVALYKAGLVNDHLLPLLKVDEEHKFDKRASVVDIPCAMNPWRDIALQWQTSNTFYATSITIEGLADYFPEMVMIFPQQIPQLPKIVAYWDKYTTLNISLSQFRRVHLDSKDLPIASSITSLLLRSAYRSRTPANRSDYLYYFLPFLRSGTLQDWYTANSGYVPAAGLVKSCRGNMKSLGIIRDSNGSSYTFRSLCWIPGVSGDPELNLEVSRVSKRADFLHPFLQPERIPEKTNSVILPLRFATVDRLHISYARFAALIPSILHCIELNMIALNLCQTLLAPIGISNISLAAQAISASAARGPLGDYQRLEFLGDSLLKYYTSLQVMGKHLVWDEGRLSLEKDTIVSNGHLYRAAHESGLPKYIVTKNFTAQKWRPTYRSDLMDTEKASNEGGVDDNEDKDVHEEEKEDKNDNKEDSRRMSTKILADVVESLIAASFLDGGEEKCHLCLRTLLPSVEWEHPTKQISTIYDAAPSTLKHFQGHMDIIEELIGYTFTKKILLLEALTHPSHTGSLTTASYQRLEFLGDSVLDNIVVREIYAHPRKFPHYAMHSLREAVVNAEFLAFLCMELSVTQRRYEICETKGSKSTVTRNRSRFSTVAHNKRLHLWEFMRHTSPFIGPVQQLCVERHRGVRLQIISALGSGQEYPWTALNHAAAEKFFSDIVESVIGAIFIDSHGSFSACTNFVGKLGVMSYLHRILNEEVMILHPKEQIGILADKKDVTYECWPEEIDNTKTFSCKLCIGDQEITTSKGSVTRIEAETRAAAEGVKLMQQQRVDRVRDGTARNKTQW